MTSVPTTISWNDFSTSGFTGAPSSYKGKWKDQDVTVKVSYVISKYIPFANMGAPNCGATQMVPYKAFLLNIARMSSCSSLHLVRLLALAPSNEINFKNPKDPVDVQFYAPFALIMEPFLKGPLSDYLYASSYKLSLKEQLKIAIDVAKGFEDLHTRNVYVGYLDHTHVFLDGEGCAKICLQTPSIETSTIRPPEAKDEDYRDLQSDSWFFGHFLQRITDGSSKDLIDIIVRCQEFDPNSRLSMLEIIKRLEALRS